MYSTASMSFGSTTKLSFMVAIGQIRTWIATLAWLAVFAVACHAAIRRLRTERQGRELPPTSSTTTPLSATANATGAPARPAGRSSTPTASERHPNGQPRHTKELTHRDDHHQVQSRPETRCAGPRLRPRARTETQLGYGTATRRGTRDFVSANQVVATKCELLVEHQHAARAHDLLMNMPREATT